MHSSSRHVVLLLVGWLALALGCESSAVPGGAAPAEAKVPDSPVSRYLPFAPGTMWAYDAEADDDANSKGMFVTRAQRLPGPRFSLISSQGAHVLEVRADGIAHAESHIYLLKAPLTLGAQWPGEQGATVRVSSVDRLVEVPAGKFVGCVETIEEMPTPSGHDPVRRVTTTYCPDVGITILHAETWDHGRHQGERATLRSFGQPVDLGK